MSAFSPSSGASDRPAALAAETPLALSPLPGGHINGHYSSCPPGKGDSASGVSAASAGGRPEPPGEGLLLSDQIVAPEANQWWRKNAPAGALLNNLMILFILAPIGLVLKSLYVLSFIVFSLMIPYGFLVRRLAVSAVRNYLASHPDSVEDFRSAGILR